MGQRERAAGRRERKSQKARKVGREAGLRLETAAICSLALGLRWGWRSLPWRWSPPPRPVPSATRARPWPALPALPRPRGPSGGWLVAPQPRQGATLGWLRVGAGRGATPVGGEVRGGGLRSGKHRAWRGRGGQSARGMGRGRGGAPWAPGGRAELLKPAVWLRLRSREEQGRRKEGSFLKAEGEHRRGKHEEPRAGCGQEADVS